MKCGELDFGLQVLVKKIILLCTFGRGGGTAILTLSSPSVFDISKSKGGGEGGRIPRPLHNFPSFNPNLMKLPAIDYWGMLYPSVVMYCT